MRALLKLEQVLPAHLRQRVAMLGAATIAPSLAGPIVDPEELTEIAAACRDCECLRFGYRGRDDTTSQRLVEPHALVTSAIADIWSRGIAAARTGARSASTGSRARTPTAPAA